METVRADTTETKRCPAAKVAKVAGLVVLGIITAAVLAIVFGLLIQWLWNELMPPIFGLPEVSYWQAVGLVVLAHILFGHHNHTHSAARKKGSRAVLGTCGGTVTVESDEKENEEFTMEWDSFREFWKDHGREAFTSWLHGREETEEN